MVTSATKPAPLDLIRAADPVGDLEAARVARVTRSTIANWRKSGRLPSVKVGGFHVYARADVLALAAERARQVDEP